MQNNSERFSYDFLRISKSGREIKHAGITESYIWLRQRAYLFAFILTPGSEQTVLLLLMPTDDIAHCYPQFLANAEASYRKHFYRIG